VKLIEGKHLLRVKLGLSRIRARVVKYCGWYEFGGAQFSAAPRHGPRGVKE
jgi:hypothetical protein